MAKRKQECACNDNYLKLRFTSVEVNREIRPQCVLCSEDLAHGSLKQAKLRWHLGQKRVKYVDEYLELSKEKKHRAT